MILIKHFIHVAFFSCTLIFSCKQVSEKEKVVTTNIVVEPKNQDTIEAPYTLMSVDSINSVIKDKKLEDFIKIVKAYYPGPSSLEGEETFSVVPELEKTPARVTILHDNIKDDSLRGIKMIFIFNGDRTLLAIRKSIRCWPEHGHSMWNAAPCS